MAHAHQAVKVAETVLEVADVAWTAVEHLYHHQHHEDHNHNQELNCCLTLEELESLKSENKRLRELLEKNLKLLQNLSASNSVLDDCPSDLHGRLLDAVDSKRFYNQLNSASVHETENAFPFREATDSDLESADILINVNKEEPSWWVWITDDMVPGTIEERSGIDDDSYVIVCEEHVVDGVANFIARCVLSNPKSQKLNPAQLQKAVASSLDGMNKFEKMMNIWHAGKLFYCMSIWGLAFAGLCRHPSVLKMAAKGVHSTSKLALKAL